MRSPDYFSALPKMNLFVLYCFYIPALMSTLQSFPPILLVRLKLTLLIQTSLNWGMRPWWASKRSLVGFLYNVKPWICMIADMAFELPKTHFIIKSVE